MKTASGERTPRIVTGVIVTGDAFVASAAKKDALRKKFKGDATEMEGAALAQICWQRRVPCLILRSLSDSAGTKAQENVLLFEKERCPECSVARYQYCRASRSAMSTRHNARAVQWD